MPPRKAKSSPYSRNFISQVLKDFEEGYSRQELLIKYKIGATTLSEWLNRYGGALYEEVKKTPVPPEKKRQVIRAIQQNRMTRREAAIFCKVHPHTIGKWLKESSIDGEIDNFEKNEMPPEPQSSQEKELAAAQLKIRALETLIDIAEEKFKIAIRKKPGAKQ